MSVDNDVLFMSVRQLGDRIRKRSLSPVELTEAYLQRGETIGVRLNAYATLMRDRALEEAHAAEKEIAAGHYRGPLHGIPYAAKDLLSAKGAPTMWGARPFRDQHFDTDATVIRRLHDAGAILLGKAAMIELAGGMGYRFASAAVTGPAKNPWNEGCWTCGSSSGSGAIVAGALAAFAIGTETWGSIICPSAYCGVSGLRPTFGRVSRDGAMALAFTMDKIGPMARAADDCALVLSVIAGNDPADPASLPEPLASFEYRPSDRKGRKLRIGWMTNQWGDVDKEIAAASARAIETLKRAGATVVDIKLPEGPWELAAGTVISVEGASAFDGLIESGRVSELVDPLGKIGGYINQTVPGSDYLRALRIREVIQRKIDQLFDDVDVLSAASLPVAATTLETNLETDLSFADPIGGIGNFCGLPAMSVPSGFTTKNLPVGIQFVGRAYDDHSVVAAGNLFQEQTRWHLKRPQI